LGNRGLVRIICHPEFISASNLRFRNEGEERKSGNNGILSMQELFNYLYLPVLV